MKLRVANQTGSASVIIPKQILRELEWEQGDEVQVVKSKKSVIISNLTKRVLVDHEEINEATILNATDLWCRITNGLIRKYKELSENDPAYAVAELRALKTLLINTGYLTEAEIGGDYEI